MTKASKPLVSITDVVLMGAGIMSATLGMLLKELDPKITIQAVILFPILSTYFFGYFYPENVLLDNENK